MKRGNEILSKIDFKCLKRGVNYCLHIAINEFTGNFEFLSKNVQNAITSDKPNQYNAPVRDMLKPRELVAAGRMTGTSLRSEIYSNGVFPLRQL